MQTQLSKFKTTLKCLLNLNSISDKDGILFSLMVLLENKEFINSPYHHQDLELIIREINNQSKAAELLMELASDYCSLKDTYHLANMQILSENPVSVDFLFNLMITKTIINGQYYQN